MVLGERLNSPVETYSSKSKIMRPVIHTQKYKEYYGNLNPQRFRVVMGRRIDIFLSIELYGFAKGHNCKGLIPLSFSVPTNVINSGYNSIIGISGHVPQIQIPSNINRLEAPANLQNTNELLIGALQFEIPQVLDFTQETLFGVNENICPINHYWRKL